jgi:hypothetical protein
MTNPMIKLVNAETGEEVVREMNTEELKQWNIDIAEAEAAKAEAAQKAANKAALLTKLGITDDEAKLLLS